MNPLISVITTSYNAEDFISHTIRSILEQDYSHCEHIIVDDGSSDNTVQIIRSFNNSRIRLIEAGRVGRGKALNMAVRASKGAYIAIQDADDLSHPERLSTEVQCLEKRRDISLLGTHQAVFRKDEAIDWIKLNPRKQSDLFEEIIDVTRLLGYCNPVSHTSLIMRRELFEQIGGYDENRKNLFDWDFCIRAAAAGQRIFKLAIPLVGKRVHGDQFFERRNRVNYIYHSSKLQVRASVLLGNTPHVIISLPILFLYRLLPDKIRVITRKYLDKRPLKIPL